MSLENWSFLKKIERRALAKVKREHHHELRQLQPTDQGSQSSNRIYRCVHRVGNNECTQGNLLQSGVLLPVASELPPTL
jgi:hypothetical protein